MAQSQRASLCEALINTLVGYAVALATQIAVFPLFGLQVSMTENLALGLIFTATSVVRSYALRRAFERRRG